MTGDTVAMNFVADGYQGFVVKNSDVPEQPAKEKIMYDDDFREMDRMENELEEDEWLSRDSKTHCGTGMPGFGSDEPQGRFISYCKTAT